MVEVEEATTVAPVDLAEAAVRDLQTSIWVDSEAGVAGQVELEDSGVEAVAPMG